MQDEFDYVIVGSGPAGCVLAQRLASDARSTICVLESGSVTHSPYIRIPGGFVKTLYGTTYTWPFRSEAGAGIQGRVIALPQGRVLGGSSAINGLVYSRGQREDFDDWLARGNIGWGYDDVLPYFRRSERRIDTADGAGDDRYRGRDGELPITNPDWHNVLCEQFIRCAEENGIARNDDYNGAKQDGAGYFQRYIVDGRRVSAADAFLRPAIATGRVDLRMQAHVTGLVIQERRAVGVRCQQGGVEKIIRARREVLVCAGTLSSPQLLQLSGIGPAGLLREIGIPVVVDAAGVGENLQDHFTVRIAARVRDAQSINELSKGWRLGREIVRWSLKRPSILGLSPSMVHVFCKSRPELTRGDLQILFTPASYKEGRNYVLDDYPGVSCGARRQRPESVGYVRIRSASGRESPLIQPNYLSAASDGDVTVAGLRLARRLMRSTALARYYEQETLPGDTVQTDDEWLDFARHRGSTGYHLVGTCKMGPAHDRHAVVDSELRVRGIEGLRVIDASVMPAVPSANTLAATLMIAEKAADMILGRAAPSRAASSRHTAPGDSGAARFAADGTTPPNRHAIDHEHRYPD